MRHELNMEEEFQLISEEMTRIFSHNYLDQVARKELFVQRSGKLKPIDFVSLCAFWNHRSGERSLTELCGLLDSKRHISLSSEGLNQRFNDAGVRLLKHLFHELFSKPFLSKRIPTLQNSDIHRIRLLDSTAFELPCLYSEKYQGYHKSGVKIQLEYELMKGDFLHLEVQHARDSDLTFGPTLIDTIQEKDLIIRDLGYFSLDDLVQIHQRKAYYLTRLKPNITLYKKGEGENLYKLDLEEIMEQMEVGEVREVENIYVSQKKKYIPRLILCKLTDEQTEQRLKKKDKKEQKKGVKYSHRSKKLSRLNIFVSNIPQACIPKEEVQPFYSLRWQIEILFKTWKSLFHIHQVKKMKVQRFECHLYGTLISLFISSTLAFQIREALYRKKKKEISEYRAISIVKEYLPSIHEALYQGIKFVLFELRRMCVQVEKNGKKSHRYRKKTVFDILGVVYERNIETVS